VYRRDEHADVDSDVIIMHQCYQAEDI